MQHLKHSWNLTPCNPIEVHLCFGGICRLHLQGRRKIQARNQREVLTCYLLRAGLIFGRFIRTWKWRRYVPLKRRLTFEGLHGVTSQKTAFFITTAVRTSDPTIRSVTLILFLHREYKMKGKWRDRASMSEYTISESKTDVIVQHPVALCILN
jgi:hypothetical protein